MSVVFVIGLLTLFLLIRKALEGVETHSHPLTIEKLANSSYLLQLPQADPGQVKFVNGEAKTVSDTYWLDTQHVGYGDLNQDGAEDAAVVIAVNSGGSGTFYNLVGVLNVNGRPQATAAVDLGDRSEIQQVSINSAEVSVKYVTQKEDDPLCCPTHEVIRTWKLDGSRWVELRP